MKQIIVKRLVKMSDDVEKTFHLKEVMAVAYLDTEMSYDRGKKGY